jgi:hypothetical protein
MVGMNNGTKTLIFLIHALVGWGLCGAVIGIGRSVTSMENTLILHALAVPLIFSVLSLVYFRFFHFTTPIQTATLFTAFAILMDVFVIAMFVEKSFAMFASILGTWIPFGLIFTSTFLVGSWVMKNQEKEHPERG